MPPVLASRTKVLIMVFKRSNKLKISTPKLSLEYMTYAVQKSTKHNKRIETNGAKIMSNEMAVIYLVFPPLEEQTKIVSFINSKTNNVAKIINKIETQISTLKELLKTLINEVLTA